jgi:glycosyltransferase involved in cell wall biosynthesis
MVRIGGNLLSFQLMAKLWREPGLKLIHAHTLGRLGGIAFTLARTRGLPFVVTIHGGVLDLPVALQEEFGRSSTAGVEWGKLFGLIFRSRRLLREADAIVTCNATEAELLRRQYPSRRTVVQPHGIPADLYRTEHRETVKATFPQLKGREVLLCVGRIDPVKNQGWLLEQLPEVLRRHPSAVLVLAGPCTDPVYGESLRHRIQTLGLEERVLLTGGLPPQGPELLGLFQTARTLLLPSVSETFGLVLVEAWAAGTPVLASRTSGACALVKPGHNGWLFSLDEPTEFHRGLDEILREPALASRFVANARPIVQAHDQSAVAGRMKALYEELIEEKETLRRPARR